MTAGPEIGAPSWVDRTDRGDFTADWRVDRCYVLGDWVIGTVEKFQPPSESTYAWSITEQVDGKLTFNRIGAIESLPAAVHAVEQRAAAAASIHGGWPALYAALERQEEAA